MIQQKPKKCKGTGKAKDFGCGKMVLDRFYGLCYDCKKTWLYSTEQGNEVLKKYALKASNKVQKESKPTRKYVKWTDKPTNEMMTYIQENIVNPYIRQRDFVNYGRCISSGGVIEHAGHFYSRGESPGMRFNCMNIHGQRGMENVHKHGDSHNYKQGLINRHGQKYFDKLEKLNIESKRIKNFDREEVIRIGKTYEYLAKKEIWCFDHEQFENYKNLINK